MTSLGERIAFYRKQSKLTQETLAEQCSVSAQAVSKWENDLNAPDVLLIPKLAELFGITCDELLGVQREVVTAVDPELIDLNKMLFRFKVISKNGDKVNMNIPLSLAELFLKNVSLKKGEDVSGGVLAKIDFEQVISLVKLGAMGKILEVVSADGDIVEGWIE